MCPEAFAPGLFVVPKKRPLDWTDRVNTEAHDERFMQEALTLARGVAGRTAPNPAVGAVIVSGGRIVGRGATRPAGKSHAEVIALAEAGVAAGGATLYVSLEPCSHHGRTPPCTEAIIAAGVARVVVAVVDPFPVVNGSGIAALRRAGLSVDVGTCADDAHRINAGFFSRVGTGRPLVTAKYAMTLDGRIATRTGHSRWITGPDARLEAHRLRDRVDAVLVGSGTVMADDPRLTTRLSPDLAGQGGPHHPLRVVVDGRGVTPLSAKVLDPTQPGNTLVATSEASSPDWRRAIARTGNDLFVAGLGPRVDLPVLLTELGRRGCNEVMVEGGGHLIGALFDAGLVDRVAAFVAPVIAGGAAAPGPVGGHGIATMPEALRLTNRRVRQLGDDVLIEGDLTRRHESGVA